jgi:hypothetical protein
MNENTYSKTIMVKEDIINANEKLKNIDTNIKSVVISNTWCVDSMKQYDPIIFNFLSNNITSMIYNMITLKDNLCYLNSSLTHLKCSEHNIKKIHRFPNKINEIKIFDTLITGQNKKFPHNIQQCIILKQTKYTYRDIFKGLNKKNKFKLKVSRSQNNEFVKMTLNKY